MLWHLSRCIANALHSTEIYHDRYSKTVVEFLRPIVSVWSACDSIDGVVRSTPAGHCYFKHPDRSRSTVTAAANPFSFFDEHFIMGLSNDSHPDQQEVVRERSTYLTDAEAATFCTMFGDGLESGMSYARIIDMLERQDYDAKLTGSMRTAILEEGNGLGAAFTRFGLLDPTARKLITIAEQQGRLPSTFKELGTYYNKRQKRRKALVSSFVEPCLLIALGMILARNILGGDLTAIAQSTDVIANLKPIFIQSGIEIGIFGTLAFFIGFAYLNLPVDMKLRSLAHRLWLTFPLPMVNSAGRLQSLATFCHYTQKSITSGLTVHRALSLAAEASNNPNIERRIPVAQEAIESGKMLAASLRESKALPDEAIDYIDVGEEAGRLEERLQDLSRRYEEEANESFERTMKAAVYITRLLVVIMVIVTAMMSVGGLLSDGF